VISLVSQDDCDLPASMRDSPAPMRDSPPPQPSRLVTPECQRVAGDGSPAARMLQIVTNGYRAETTSAPGGGIIPRHAQLQLTISRRHSNPPPQ
jgi:hypothetical protein